MSLPRALMKKADKFDMVIYMAGVFIKIQDSGNREGIKHLSQLTRKFPDHIFNFDD